MTPAEMIATLTARGLTVATAESLTGGLVCAALTDVPGASACVRGGVIAYAVPIKRDVLGVDGGLLDRRGAIDPDVAIQMAAGVRGVLGADVGVATTGSAGPDPAPGGNEAGPVPPGIGFVAVVGPAGSLVRGFSAAGDRSRVRAAAVDAALDLLGQALGAD